MKLILSIGAAISMMVGLSAFAFAADTAASPPNCQAVVTQNISAHPDQAQPQGATQETWAFDSYTETAQVCDVGTNGDGTDHYQLTYNRHGSFVTQPGAQSPNDATVKEAAIAVAGTLDSQWTVDFSATSDWKTYKAPATPTYQGSGVRLAQSFFTDTITAAATNSDDTFVYKTCSEQYTQAAFPAKLQYDYAKTVGNITGKPCPTTMPSPSPGTAPSPTPSATPTTPGLPDTGHI